MFAMKHIDPTDDFQLDDDLDANQDFQLESLQPEPDTLANTAQTELFLPDRNPEEPTEEPQLEFAGLEKPIYAVRVSGHEASLQFHYANNLLESLEAQGVHVPYQCREGYCGGCRTDLISGEVAYLQEPMAWINEGEILPCCCVPKTALCLKLKG